MLDHIPLVQEEAVAIATPGIGLPFSLTLVMAIAPTNQKKAIRIS
jgi:hypothetical protein